MGWRDRLKAGWDKVAGGAAAIETAVVDTAKAGEAYVEKKAEQVEKVVVDAAHDAEKKVVEVAHDAKEFVKKEAHEVKAYADKKVDQAEAYVGKKADAVGQKVEHAAQWVDQKIHGPAKGPTSSGPDVPATPATPEQKSAPLLDNAYAASAQAYDLTKGGKPAPGWHEVTYPANSPKGQALATARAHELVAPNGQHFVAFTGTQPSHASDIATDLLQAAGVKTSQYEAAAKLGELYKGESVIMTGHSLGGGLAKTAAAVASHGGPQTVSIGFDSAPVGTRVLREHGVDPNHLDSKTVQVLSQADTVNRLAPGGQTHLLNGQVIKDRVGDNEKVIIADTPNWTIGKGHLLASIGDKDHPGALTTKLTQDGNPIDKATVAQYLGARDATANTPAVVQALEHAAPAPELAQKREAHAR